MTVCVTWQELPLGVPHKQGIRCGLEEKGTAGVHITVSGFKPNCGRKRFMLLWEYAKYITFFLGWVPNESFCCVAAAYNKDHIAKIVFQL